MGKIPGLYRAYHMNKLHWVSVFLDGTVTDEEIKDLIAERYEMTSRKKRRNK